MVGWRARRGILVAWMVGLNDGVGSYASLRGVSRQCEFRMQ